MLTKYMRTQDGAPAMILHQGLTNRDRKMSDSTVLVLLYPGEDRELLCYYRPDGKHPNNLKGRDLVPYETDLCRVAFHSVLPSIVAQCVITLWREVSPSDAVSAFHNAYLRETKHSLNRADIRYFLESYLGKTTEP